MGQRDESWQIEQEMAHDTSGLENLPLVRGPTGLSFSTPRRPTIRQTATAPSARALVSGDMGQVPSPPKPTNSMNIFIIFNSVNIQYKWEINL